MWRCEPKLTSDKPTRTPNWVGNGQLLLFQANKIWTAVNITTSEKSNFNPKKFTSCHFLSLLPFLSSVHIITLLSPFPLSLSLSLPGLFAFSHPLCLAPSCLPTLSLAWPHLHLSHCHTTSSNPTLLEYHYPTLISNDPFSSSSFTSWVFLLFFSLFFVCFYFWVFI